MSPGTWPTVGRDHELSLLTSAVDAARLGTGRMVLVEGVAGAGKSHLLDELCRALDTSVTLARATVPISELSTPFSSPLTALGLGLVDLGVESGGPRSMIEAGAGEVAQAVVVDLLLQTVEDRCDTGPLIVVLDDVHAADLGTLVWLDRLADRVAVLPLAVILGARPPLEGTAFDRFHRAVGDGDMLLRLEPLDDDAVAELVTSVLGSPPGPGLCSLLERADGLPLFLAAVLEGVVEDDLVRSGGVVDLADDPRTRGGKAPDAVAERVRSLPAELRPALLAAAVLAESITADQVRSVLGSPLVEVISALDIAERSGLLVAETTSYRFRHELYRQAVLDGVSPPVLAALHGAAAAACAATGEPPIVVARHLVAAGGSGAEMAQWLIGAAETIVAYEPQNALTMADAALKALGTPSRRLAAVRGRALASVGRVGEAEALLRQMLHAAASPGEELGLRRELALALFQQGRPAEAMIEMTRVVELAPDEIARARARAEESFTHLLTGQFERAGEIAAEEFDAGGRSGDLTTQVAAAMVLCLVRLYHGEMAAALGLADRLEYLTGLGATTDAAVYQPWFAAGMARVEADDHVGARRIAALGQQRCIDAGYQWMVPGYDALASYCSLRAGELDDAVAEATAALDWRISDRLGVAVWCHAFSARAAVHQGRLEFAATQLAAADALIDQGRAQLGWDHVGLARAALAERHGDLDAAYAALADVWDLHLALGVRSAVQETGPELVRLETLLGRTDRTAAVLEVLDLAAATIGDATRLADRERALAWANRDLHRLELAIEHSRRSPRRLVTATTTAELASWLKERGARRESEAAARAAAELFTACGAVGDAQSVRPLLARSSRAADLTASAPPALSRTESKVVALLAEGLANAEIAGRLHVSRRTVESHVSSAYRKLGVSNRVELARIGLRLDVGSPG